MKKTKQIVVLIIIIVLISCVVNVFLPTKITDGFYEVNVSDGIEYKSNKYRELNKKQYGLYAFLNDSLESNKKEFVISVLEVKGILKNKENLISYSPQLTEEVLNPQYKNIVNFPEYAIKNGSNYYGYVFCGIVPLDCKSITIDGNEAELHRMTFELDGQKADFYVYFCVIEQNQYTENFELICTTQSGEKIEIVSIDGKDNSNVIRL